MKKIAIITWYNAGMNYGQTLQAYAMAKKLEMLGYFPEVITYGNRVYSNVKWINRLMRYRQAGAEKRDLQKAFDAFADAHINHSRPLKRKKDVERYLKAGNFEVIICGSDQIWNPYNVDPVYYLALNGSYRRVAYAPSIIAGKFSNKFDEYPDVKKWLGKIDNISVRENTGAEIIEKLVGIRPKVVLDPTMLLTCKDWEGLLSDTEKEKTETYAFCYLFDLTQRERAFIFSQAKKSNCDKIVFADILLENVEGITTVKDMTIEQFLLMIRGAEVVFTDSFHGTIFSILFHKEFFAIDNDIGEDVDKYYNIDRMATLLGKLGLENRLLEHDCNTDALDEELIDYTLVEKRLEEERKESIGYLLDAIEGEESEYYKE